MDPQQRPLSPHIQVYKPQITSIFSILHRLTGVYLSLGIVALSVWVIALGRFDPCFTIVSSLYKTAFFQLLFAGWVISYFYHLGNGIRHLIWDIGYGYDLKTVYQSALFVLLFTIITSAFVLFSLF